ncbi:MAG: hypothetical protein M5U12_09205 [Verrucomicrobia bacterium]|nr:hypothetical protein [Verrucomicrobiota bacterium]
MPPLTRRQFLAQSTRGTTALALGAGAALSAANRLHAQGANDRVVLALMGAGGRGSGLAINFVQVPGVELKVRGRCRPEPRRRPACRT